MPTPFTSAEFSYPNPNGFPGEVLVYRCPFCGPSRTHFTLLQNGHDSALTLPPCGLGGPMQRLLRVLPPPAPMRLSAPPLDEWRADFEAERRRARGGRPRKKAVPDVA